MLVLAAPPRAVWRAQTTKEGGALCLRERQWRGCEALPTLLVFSQNNKETSG